MDWQSGKFKYREAENDFYKIFISGILYVENEPNIDPLLLAERVALSKIDYNTIHGWYRVIIYDKRKEQYIFFGDAAGSQRLFFDSESFSDSFLAIRAHYANHADPNAAAIAELFQFGRILGNSTVVRGIMKTNPDCFYTYRGGVIEHSKKLCCFSEMKKALDLEDVMAPLYAEKALSSFCAVCTGGTDSRAVIANLSCHGLRPNLVLTGHSDNPDVPVAKELAGILDLPLKIIDPSEKEEDWLNLSFDFLDGNYDVVLGYRQRTKALWAKNGNNEFEFGGVAGEFYKNSFCHPFRNGLFKKCDREYLFRTLFAKTKTAVSQKWYGELLKQAQDDVQGHIEQIIDGALQEKSMLAKCNRVGYEFLRNGSGAITHGYSSVTCKIDPLMDRSLVASVSQRNPFSLSMSVWQRKQIAKYNAKLSDVPTDQGYSCTIRFVPFLAEVWKKECSRVIARIRRKLGLFYKSAENKYWDSDYQEAKNTQTYQNAVEFCVKQGILQTDEVPTGLVGNVLLVGMVFDEKRWE